MLLKVVRVAFWTSNFTTFMLHEVVSTLLSTIGVDFRGKVTVIMELEVIEEGIRRR